MRRIAAAALLISAACARPAGPPAIVVDTDPVTRATIVRVTGLSTEELSSLRTASPTPEQWSSLLRISVAAAPADAPAVLGRYAVSSEAIEFAPRFPFDPGREYSVAFDPQRLPVPRTSAVVRGAVTLASTARAPSTVVARMWPSADVLPSNLLRVYLEFSAPMSRENGRDFITLLDDRGRELPNSFLALDVEFWSPDYQRYTLFLDPGRVKRGILPNDQLGRALTPGRKYTIDVDPRWRDANGLPLAAPFRRTFTAGPPALEPISPIAWTIAAPRAGSRDPLRVTFPAPLDHGLLARAIGVAASGGPDALPGDIVIGDGEREWAFTPASAWTAGAYDLVVLGMLEDPSGNRIDRPFDVDRFERIDPTPAPDRRTRPFTIR